MKKEIICLMILFVIGVVSAISSPHAFYGKIYYSDGALVNENLEIKAEINENNKTDNLVDGVYDLVVESTNNGIVYFYIQGLTEPIGTYEFKPYEVTELDFITNLSNPNSSEDSSDSGSESHSSGGSGTSKSGRESSSLLDTYDEYSGETSEGNNLAQDLGMEKTNSKITGNTIGNSEFNKILGISSVGLILVLLFLIIIIINKKKH